MSYKYFDTPKGEDILDKVIVTSKYAGAAGLIVSTGDVMLYSYPKGYMATFGRYLNFCGPFIATAATFTVTSNLLCNARKKDDRWNFFWGGVAAGTIVGAWRKSMMVGFLSGLGFGVLGIIKKDSIDEKWPPFIPEPHPVYAGVHTQSYDFTLTKERPRNWTTCED